MSLKLNKSINMQIRSVINFEETFCLGRTKMNTYSVDEILKASKSRKEQQNSFNNPIFEEIKKTMPNLVNIEVLPSFIDDGSVFIIFKLNDGVKTYDVTLQYKKDNSFEFYFKDIKRNQNGANILLTENRNYYRELGNYAIRNKFNEELQIITISNVFRIHNTGREFSICMPSDLMSLLRKYVHLVYYYNQNNTKNIIETTEGIFNVETNVPGVKRLLSSNSIIKKEELNNVLRFLQNLKVSENDVPEYLKEEIEKVKVLKK